jgi:hypothetical protein
MGLEALRANECVDEVRGEEDGHAATENVIQEHWCLSDQRLSQALV